MSHGWEAYLTHIDDKPASIVIDLDAGEALARNPAPFLTVVRLELKSPDENGLPSKTEFADLGRVDEAIRECLPVLGPAIEVGGVTFDGKRTFFLYSEGAPATDAFKSALQAKVPDYGFLFSTRPEPDRETYFEFLFPSPAEMQLIGNQSVIRNLLENGDTLEKPRPVDHFIYFGSQLDRSLFKLKIADLEYESCREAENGEPPDVEYGLHIVKISAVDPETINGISMRFFQTARECNGEYDGWGAPVVQA